MNYLKDTCVFIKKVNSGTEILNIAKHCMDIGDKFCITDIVYDELYPGLSVNQSDAEISRGIIDALNMSFKTKLVRKYDVKVNHTYKQNFDRIRTRYYDHLLEPSFIKEKIQEGEITIEQVRNKSYLHKDYGECSCIAVAMESPEEFIIVSNDKGRIFLKQDINLFKIYEKSHKIRVWNYNEWVVNTDYTEMSKAIKTS